MNLSAGYCQNALIFFPFRFTVEGAYAVQSLEQAVELAKNFANTAEIMIIGGGTV